MYFLDGLHVLVVEDDPDIAELLSLALESRHATSVVAHSGAAGLAAIRARRPDVLLCDLSLPDGAGADWLPRLHAVAAAPAIALSGSHSDLERERAMTAGFAKYLLKPASFVDIVSAIRMVTGGPLRPLLADLAESTNCRYASLFRFDRNALASVWTHDRELPDRDPFPLRVPISASYCDLVRAANQLVAIEDARTDPRAEGHPKQRELRAYVGAPVTATDGSLLGTLCSYDVDARTFGPAIRHGMLAAAQRVAALVP